MILLYIVAALVLLVVLAVVVFRPAGPELESSARRCLEEDSDCSLGLRERDASRRILGRLFSDEDQSYIAGFGSVRLRRLLAVERKRIAIQWIRDNAAEARSIVRDHMRPAATAEDLRVRNELRLAAHYLELLLLSNVLIILVSAVGPDGFSGLAGRADTAMAALRGMNNVGESSARAAHSN
jgi:hypothetical protein